MIEPGFSAAPLTLNSCGRQSQHFGGFFDRQAAEEFHFNDLALLWIDLIQSLERVIKGNDFRRSLLRNYHGVIQRNLMRPAAALCVSVAACMIHQDSAHQLCGNSEEVCAVLP